MASPQTQSDVQSTVIDLNAGWYNVVRQALNLDAATFQLAQGTLGLQTSDSSGLFRMSDAVPPSASVAYFDAGGMVMRSSAYGLLLHALLPETGSDLRQALGDQYANWITYRNNYWTQNLQSTLTQEQLFEQWANRFLDPQQASTAITVFKKAATTPLNQALDALVAPGAQQQFVDSASQAYSLYKYSATVEAAKQAIANGTSASISFDSKTMDTKLVHTTAHGSATGFYDIFWGGAGGGFEQLNQKASSSEWSISGTINKYATLATEAGSWFISGELARAYNAKDDNTVWDPMANVGDWHSFFDQDSGSLARRVSQLVLVSDYELTVTSSASYSSEELTKIQTDAHFGIWPFFSSSASVTHTQQVTTNAEGQLVVEYKLNPGLIQIWGVTVQSAPS